jgi:hypothetical protein
MHTASAPSDKHANRVLPYNEPVKRHVSPKLAAALAVSKNLSAAHGERRRSMLLQSPVRVTRRRGAAVHAASATFEKARDYARYCTTSQ